MAKVKVSELATQLDKSGSEVISYLRGRGLDVEADTELDDDLAAAVKKAMMPKKEGEGIKKRASVVFRPQNSAQNRGKVQGKGGQQTGQRRTAGQTGTGRTAGQRTGVRTVSAVGPNRLN